MQIPSDVQALLDRVKSGGKLSESERLEALDALDRAGAYTATQLSQLLGVTDRQIRRDRAKLRKRYQQALRDLDLVGELYRQFEITIGRIDEAIVENNYQRVRALALRWGVCESFARIAFHFQIDELSRLVETIRARANGHALTIN